MTILAVVVLAVLSLVFWLSARRGPVHGHCEGGRVGVCDACGVTR